MPPANTAKSYQEELEDACFPPENRFLISFQSQHLLTTGGWATQNLRKYRLADCREDALASVEKELEAWNPAFHKHGPLTCGNCTGIPPGESGRYSGDNDIRKCRKNQETVIPS